MEGAIKSHTMKHLVNNKLISTYQHRFVNKRASVTNLLLSQEFITLSLQKNNWVDILFTDFEKAFDKVLHRFLIYKAQAYGIDGNILEWIKSFLSGRKQ